VRKKDFFEAGDRMGRNFLPEVVKKKLRPEQKITICNCQINKRQRQSTPPFVYYSPPELQEQIGVFVECYNHNRYHEALNNVTPSDVYYGRDREILEMREQIKQQTMRLRRKQSGRLSVAETTGVVYMKTKTLS
jgi:hypothetical protein